MLYAFVEAISQYYFNILKTNIFNCEILGERVYYPQFYKKTPPIRELQQANLTQTLYCQFTPIEHCEWQSPYALKLLNSYA